MIYHFDHRASSVAVNPDNLKVAASSEETTLEQHTNPGYHPIPQYWIDGGKIELRKDLSWALGFRDITNPTNARTMISTIIPRSGVGNTLPIILPDSENAGSIRQFIEIAPNLLGNLNSFALDFLARQKVQGQRLNWYIVEQLPVIPPEKFEGKIGKMRIADFIRREVLRLTYTAHDMEPFARDMDFSGDPFIWDAEDRRHRMAKLDALFFLLYGIYEEDAGYILDAFPIVRREDETAFDGRYYTKELILAWMRALKAGDTEAKSGCDVFYELGNGTQKYLW